MILSVHKEYTDQLELVDIGNEFVRESHHRENVFGTFLKSDIIWIQFVCNMSTLVGVAFGSSLDGPPTLNLLPTPLNSQVGNNQDNEMTTSNNKTKIVKYHTCNNLILVNQN